jgi:hypothetical protein
MIWPFSKDVLIESPLPVEQCTARLEKITARYVGWIFSNADERNERPIAGQIKNHSIKLCSRAYLGKARIRRYAYLSGQNTPEGSVWSGPLRPTTGDYVFFVILAPIVLGVALNFFGEARESLDTHVLNLYFAGLTILLIGIAPPLILLRLSRKEAYLLDCISQEIDGKILKPSGQIMDNARS